MPDLEKFEDTERKIAQAENGLLKLNKFVGVDFEEDDIYHLEEHEKGGDNMPTKAHIQSHKRQAEQKLREKMHRFELESSMPL